MNKEHEDPDVIDLDAPRLAWNKQKTWKKHQNTVHLVDIKLAQKKEVLSSIKHDRTQSSFTTRSQLVVSRRAIMMGTGEIKYEKVYASPRPLPKMSFEDNWMEELGSEVAGGVQDSQQTQPKTKHPSVRTGRPVLAEQPSGSSAQEIDKRVLLGCESTNERTGRLVFQLCASVC